MKSLGITRPIDQLGRVVIPMELRKSMNLNENDRVEIFTDGDTIVLRKYQAGCTFCGEMDNLIDFGGEHICRKCGGKILEVLHAKR